MHLFVLQQNSPGFCPGRVRSSTMCSWHVFHFFRTSFHKIWNKNDLKHHSQKKKRNNKNKWVRATIPGTSARTIVSCLRSEHARRPPWEPLDMFIGSCFDVWGPFFRSHFRKLFFLKNDAKWSSKPKSQENIVKNDTWNEVEKTCTKCVKIDAAGPVKNEFSNGRVVKNHENQRCEQLRKHVKNWCQTSTEITEKWALELNKKRCLKTYTKNSKNTQKWLQKWTSKTH